MRKRTGASWHLAAWSTLPTTSRTSACVKPVTGDDVKPACRLTLLRPSLTSSAWLCSVCSEELVSSPRSNPEGQPAHQRPPGPATKPCQPLLMPPGGTVHADRGGAEAAHNAET